MRFREGDIVDDGWDVGVVIAILEPLPKYDTRQTEPLYRVQFGGEDEEEFYADEIGLVELGPLAYPRWRIVKRPWMIEDDNFEPVETLNWSLEYHEPSLRSRPYVIARFVTFAEAVTGVNMRMGVRSGIRGRR